MYCYQSNPPCTRNLLPVPAILSSLFFSIGSLFSKHAKDIAGTAFTGKCTAGYKNIDRNTAPHFLKVHQHEQYALHTKL